MKKRRFDEMRNGSKNRDTKQTEVIQIMRKDRGIRSWSCIIATVVAVLGMSLLLVQMAGAVNYTIQASAGSGGTISPSGNVSVVRGTDKIFTITPNAGYAIASLTVDNASVTPPRKTYKFTRVSAAHSITATFAQDSDNDGIPDTVENQGISFTLSDGVHTYPPCAQDPALLRADCVDPATKDVFVVLAQAANGYFSELSDPLEYVTKSVGGLPITVHLIRLPAPDTGDRFLSPNSAEKYVRITESLDTSDPTVLGSSTCGTPDQDLGTVYTQRIVNHVNSVCSGAGSCSGVPLQDLIIKYIKHTITHEFAHMVGPLAPVYNSNLGGYHYASEANDRIMNQSVFYTGTNDAATFYIGTSYTSDDQAGVKLK